MEKKLSLTDSLSWIKKGKILIHPTESIWGIGCDAFNEETVKQIYELKKRGNLIKLGNKKYNINRIESLKA